MKGVTTQSGTQPSQAVPNQGVNIILGADTIFVMIGLLWLAWDRIFRSRIVTKLDGVFTPVEEERKLTYALAQIGLITRASRVILTAFHNGQIDNCGYHLTKITTINSYVAPGAAQMQKPIRDLPLGRIMYEIEALLKHKDSDYLVTVARKDLPEPCRDHLIENGIGRMYNRLVKVGNLPIGILSIQYHEVKDMDEFIYGDPYRDLLEVLYQDIAGLMRRRVIHPSKLRKLLRMVGGGRR